MYKPSGLEVNNRKKLKGLLAFDPIITLMELFTKEVIENCRKNFLYTVVHGNILE